MRKKILAAILAATMLAGCGGNTESLAPAPSPAASGPVSQETGSSTASAAPDATGTAQDAPTATPGTTPEAPPATGAAATTVPTPATTETADGLEITGVDTSYFAQFDDMPKETQDEVGEYLRAIDAHNLYVRSDGMDPATDGYYFEAGRKKADEAMRLVFDVGPDTPDYTDKILSMNGGYSSPSKEYNVYSTIKGYGEFHPAGDLDVREIRALNSKDWDGAVMLVVDCLLPCTLTKDGKESKVNVFCGGLIVYVLPDGRSYVVGYGDGFHVLSDNIEARWVRWTDGKAYRTWLWCSDDQPVYDVITVPDYNLLSEKANG